MTTNEPNWPNRYRMFLETLVRVRAQAGGHLAPHQESSLVAELDRCWGQMTEREQEEATLDAQALLNTTTAEYDRITALVERLSLRCAKLLRRAAKERVTDRIVALLEALRIRMPNDCLGAGHWIDKETYRWISPAIQLRDDISKLIDRLLEEPTEP